MNVVATLRLSSLKSLGSLGLSTQQRKVAAVHQRNGGRDRPIDPLAQWRVLPLDRGNIARLLVKEDRSELSPGRAFLFAVKRPNKEREVSALLSGKPLSARHGSGRPAGQTTVQTLQAVQARVEIAVQGNKESAALPTKSTNEPEPMASGGIVEQHVPAVARFDAHLHRRKTVEGD
jgi:hypothetical protein